MSGMCVINKLGNAYHCNIANFLVIQGSFEKAVDSGFAGIKLQNLSSKTP
jgi:hypothetical protein